MTLSWPGYMATHTAAAKVVTKARLTDKQLEADPPES
jgi:hypothetical protein